MSFCEDMAHLLPERLGAICPGSKRRLSAPFTPGFPARHLPTLLCHRVWCHGSKATGCSTTHGTQVLERHTPAKWLQEYFDSSTQWKVDFATVDKGGYFLFTMLSGPMGWVLHKLFHLSIITRIESLSCPSTHCTHKVGGFRKALTQHSLFPSYAFT